MGRRLPARRSRQIACQSISAGAWVGDFFEVRCEELLPGTIGPGRPWGSPSGTGDVDRYVERLNSVGAFFARPIALALDT
jgi:hypothetical protein